MGNRIMNKKGSEEYVAHLEKVLDLYLRIIADLIDDDEDKYYLDQLIEDVVENQKKIVYLNEVIGRYQRLLKLQNSVAIEIEDNFKKGIQNLDKERGQNNG